MITAAPLTQKQAKTYILTHHRHHKPSCGDVFRIGAAIDGRLVGVAQVGRPVARRLDKGKIIEITRLCTDGTPNVCSFLYSRAARVARELGYEKIIWDRVIMNPPFARQQDIDHIYKAFDVLKSGGVLVSVISISPFFRTNRKSVEFKDWLSDVGAEITELSEGAFKDSGTMLGEPVQRTAPLRCQRGRPRVRVYRRRTAG